MVSLLAGCVDQPDDAADKPGVVNTERITLNRITLNRITLNRITLNRITLNRIALDRISDNRLRVNGAGLDTLLSTDGGREVFSLVVNCAIPADISLVATVDGADLDFPGEIGLAPEWLRVALPRTGQNWVSACMLARVNNNELSQAISIRGLHRGLEASADEREAFSLEEGAFYGNVFGPTSEPIQAFACRGRDQAAGETGGLVERDCTEPDPAHPGFTLCGMVFAGDCGNFAPDRACELFAPRGTFYLGCHTAPIARHPRRGDQIFQEVITSFVTP
jgi:hypothetical protein